MMSPFASIAVSPNRDPRKSVLVLLAAAAALVLIASMLFLDGFVESKTAYAVTGLAMLGPLAVFLIVRRPAITFAIYAVVVPLENLIHIGGVGTLAKAIGGGAGLVLIAALILKRRAVPVDRAVYFWLVFILWMASSLFWALDPNFSGVINVVQVAQLFVLYAIISMTPMTIADLSAVIIGSTIGGVIGGSYSINQYIHGYRPNAGAWQRLYISGGDNVIDSNHFAAAMQLPIALTAVATMQAKRLALRLPLLAALGIMFVSLLLGASRGGIIALGVMTVYFAVKTRKIKAMLTMVALAFVASLAFPSVWARFNDPSQGEGSGRLDIWRLGFDAFRQHWLLGVGEGNFQVAYDQSFLKIHQVDFQGWSRPSHNILLGMATELGIIGLALLILAARAQFRSVSLIPKDSQLYPIRVAVEGAFLAIVAEGMFLDILWYKYVWMTFALMAALRSTYLTTRSSLPLSSGISRGTAP